MSSRSTLPEVVTGSMPNTAPLSCSGAMTPEIRVASDVSADFFDADSGADSGTIDDGCGAASSAQCYLGRNSPSPIGSCCRSPSPTSSRRLSAPGSAGSPSRFRRCSVEEPYVFSVAQAAAAAAAGQLRRTPPSPLMLAASGSSSANQRQNPDDQQMLASPSPDADSVASGAGAGGTSPASGSPRWDMAVICGGGSSVSVSGNGFGHVIRHPICGRTMVSAAAAAATMADSSMPSVVAHPMTSASFDCSESGAPLRHPGCVVVDPPPSDAHSRWSSRSLSLPPFHSDFVPLQFSSLSSSDASAHAAAPPAVSGDIANEAAGSPASGIDFLRLPAGWTTLDEATGLPRRRHSVASGRASTSAQLESIAEEASGAGNSGGSGQCLLQPKGSIRRYSIPETVSASRAAAAAASSSTSTSSTTTTGV